MSRHFFDYQQSMLMNQTFNSKIQIFNVKIDKIARSFKCLKPKSSKISNVEYCSILLYLNIIPRNFKFYNNPTLS